MSFLDFEAIKQANPIEQVAASLALEMSRHGEQLRGPSPLGEGGPRALVITPSKGKWYDFSESTGGDSIALVAHVKGCTMKEAAEFLLGDKPLGKPDTPSATPEGNERGFKALAYLEAAHDAVEALGFDSVDAERLGIGFAPRGVLRGKVAVPIRLTDGTLAGYIGIDDAKLPPKWQM